jgi:hypothetical protein
VTVPVPVTVTVTVQVTVPVTVAVPVKVTVAVAVPVPVTVTVTVPVKVTVTVPVQVTVPVTVTVKGNTYLKDKEMNLDELTLGQIKQLQSLLVGTQKAPMPHRDIGKKVIIRTYSAGVHYGTLISKEGNEVILENAIRIWSWSGACSLSQLAMEGTKNSNDCKFAMTVDHITLEMIEIIPCTEKAIKSIEEVPAWKK